MGKQTIEVPVDEVRRVFELLEKVQDLFHQPMKYRDIGTVEAFAKDNYEEIRTLYYDLVWDWLPKAVQDEVTGDDD